MRISSDLEWIRRFEESDLIGLEERDNSQADPVCDVLFFGSSSIRLWESLAEDMAPLKVVNRGYGGATVRDIMYNYERVFSAYQPRKLVFYCDNEISGGDKDVTVGENYDLYRILFNRIREDYPEVPLYFLSAKYSRTRAGLREQQRMVNWLMREYALHTPGIFFVDVTTPLLLEDGEVNDQLYLEDRLHITREGYRKWTAVLKPLLLE